MLEFGPDASGLKRVLGRGNDGWVGKARTLKRTSLTQSGVSMKLWSKGLGRTEIDMDFRRYVVTADPKTSNAIVSGHIVDPVKWEFRITVTPEDIPGIIKLALNLTMIKLLLFNFYKYFVYLFTRKNYIPTDKQSLLEKVNNSYEKMVVGGKR